MCAHEVSSPSYGGVNKLNGGGRDRSSVDGDLGPTYRGTEVPVDKETRHALEKVLLMMLVMVILGVCLVFHLLVAVHLPVQHPLRAGDYHRHVFNHERRGQCVLAAVFLHCQRA